MKERNYKLYVHISPSNKRYYGITCQKVEQRWQNGRGYLYSNNAHLQNAINKYGWENFKHLVVFNNLTKEEAFLLEKMYIALYNTMNPKYGYNATRGGEGMDSDINSIIQSRPEVRAKKSQAMKALYNNPNSTYNSPEYRKKQSIIQQQVQSRPEVKAKKSKAMTGENNPMYGKHHSEEMRAKMRGENNVAKRPEVRAKISNTKKGKPSPTKGKHLTEEHKRKLSEVRIGRYTREDSGRAKKVICMETGEIFNCVRDAEEKYHPKHNYKACNIYNCCNGYQKTAYKMHWEYYTDEQVQGAI